MRRRALVALVALFAALALAACNGPKTGVVVQKDYQPAYWYTTTCYRSESTVVGGQTTTRQVPYPCQQYRPDSYRLYLREDVGTASSREPEEGWRSVSSKVYMACEVQQFFEEGVCR